MSLEDEIKETSKQISTDSYPMSIGEITSLYRDKELDIHPEFQRFFRWTELQKSKFIESLLLGIPIPSIFISQTEKGKWDVIDGLQRLSTIFELMGELKDNNEEIIKRLVLTGTKYLPSLANFVWKEPEQGQNELPELAKLKIKRSKLDLKIVLNTSDPNSKYELFERINTGGSIATDQEVRNCILIMENQNLYLWLLSLREYRNFQACIPLSEKQADEQYDMELIVRFVILWNMSKENLNTINDVGIFLTEEIRKIAENDEYPKEHTERVFKKTFDLLAERLGESSFKKFHNSKNCATGAFLISMFEIIGLGIAYNIENPNYDISIESLVKKQRIISSDEHIRTYTGSGVRASTRIPVTIPFGRETFRL